MKLRRLMSGLLARPIAVGRSLPPPPPRSPDAPRGPDWVQADPDAIAASLARARALPGGGWFVVDASRALRGPGPRRATIGGGDLVLWREPDGTLRAAPDACPHMGASLAGGRVDHAGRVVCPWHGLALGAKGFRDWRCVPVHDDGVLVWVRLPGEAPTDAPVLAPRPRRALDAVIRMEARCEPEDILANRLDPWHGAHFHPYAFGTLTVLDASDDVLTLRVAYRIAGPLRIEVDATFHCPDPRTIVMTIIAGDGVGSVVETHATPIGPGRTAMIEATLATSDRSGFGAAVRATPLLRPLVQRAARRLWVDDVAYAERRYALRTRS